jgi:LysW-gamma-L-lysine carboxypeptidase
MEEGYPESLLTRMLQTYSPSGSEGEITILLAEEMRGLGFKVTVDEVGNVEGRAGSGSPKILLCGHMDTVEGFLEVKKRGKVIFGRGAVDAKSPLTALICGGARHAQGGGKGSLVVLAVVDEEGKSRGMKHYLSRSTEIFDYALFGEPSGAYAVTVGYKGRMLFRINISTSTGHASAPQLFENAVYVGINVVERLRGLEARWTSEGGDLFNMPTLAVTKMSGGGADNTVPAQCEVVVDVRVPPTRTMLALKEEVHRVIADVPKGEAKVDVTLEDENWPYTEPPESKLVKAFLESIKAVKGEEGRLSRKTGTSDVNDFVRRYGTSAAVYGPGNSKLDHTPLENVSLQELQDSVAVVEGVLKRISR